MIDVLLSASVPLPQRDQRYFDSADTLAIREAIKALVEVILPVGRITFGGHPAITPLIAFFVQEGKFPRDRLTVFQSRFFEKEMPVAIQEYYDVRLIDAVSSDRAASLLQMRKAMIQSRAFSSAVFIGGMEGVADEANLVMKLAPNVKLVPVASTGAAARDVFRRGDFLPEFETELTYATLFRKHLVP